LGEHVSPAVAAPLAAALSDPNPIVRLGAATALRNTPVQVRAALLPSLSHDPVRSVRIEVGRALAGVPPAQLAPADQRAAQQALAEWIAVQTFGADRAESHLNLGALAAESGELDKAEREYLTALKLSPRFPGTYMNLADLYRQRERDEEGERVLREGLKIAPQDPNMHAALGLALVREKKNAEALASLEKATRLAPEDPHHAFVFAIALSAAGQMDRALAVLAAAHARHPGDRDVLHALVSMSRDTQSIPAAIEYAKKLVALDPDDPSTQKLLGELEAQKR
jgi:Flp pilus assembly protein TadD